jgi:hypothetical protein
VVGQRGEKRSEGRREGLAIRAARPWGPAGEAERRTARKQLRAGVPTTQGRTNDDHCYDASPSDQEPADGGHLRKPVRDTAENDAKAD